MCSHLVPHNNKEKGFEMEVLQWKKCGSVVGVLAEVKVWKGGRRCGSGKSVEVW